jgi:hypothetical protein
MLAPPPAPDAEVADHRPRRPIIAPRRSAARWCGRCGAPRNLGRHDCPGCRLLDESRERIANYLARHGMPDGGAIELARRADVPLRAVGELMTRRHRPKPRPPRGMQYYSRTVRTARKLAADGPAPGGS